MLQGSREYILCRLSHRGSVGGGRYFPGTLAARERVSCVVWQAVSPTCIYDLRETIWSEGVSKACGGVLSDVCCRDACFVFMFGL